MASPEGDGDGRRLRIALIDGPTYTPLYARLPAFTARTGIAIDVVIRAPHAGLNEAVANAQRDDEALDVISTHIKYAPSQAAWLLPLDDLLPADDLHAFVPDVLRQCRVEGRLIQLPRLTDTRLLHYRTDWFEDDEARRAFRQQFGRDLAVPETWAHLAEVASFFATGDRRWGFAFPAVGSGLFGTFFELVRMAGGDLFAPDGSTRMQTDAANWALGYLHELHAVRRVTPPGMEEWDFDDVTAAFMRGELAMIADWPASFGLLTDSAQSAVADRFDVALYPLGPASERHVYSGSHSFAITRRCADREAALALIRDLTSRDAQEREASRGAIPARRDVVPPVSPSGVDDRAARRSRLLAETVATSMVSFPSDPRYPELEDTAWPLLRDGFTGRIPVDEALRRADRLLRDAGWPTPEADAGES